jgi:hypothetical protein
MPANLGEAEFYIASTGLPVGSKFSFPQIGGRPGWGLRTNMMGTEGKWDGGCIETGWGPCSDG